MQTAIEVVDADITTLAVDAIVNAANRSLLGGGGVDGAIHRAAGPALLAACRALPQQAPGIRCPTGEARVTGGFDLPTSWIIHTVGPVWQGGTHGEAALLAACYRNALACAAEVAAASIAIPAISCGAYGYPLEQAAAIAVRESQAWLDETGRPGRILLCCHGRTTTVAFQRALAGAR